jgi:hypothetical protein
MATGKTASPEAAARLPGDPALAAKAVMEALADPSPPQRLVLGASAVQVLRSAYAHRIAEIERWQSLSESADGVP